jgi:hypothetical protein
LRQNNLHPDQLRNPSPCSGLKSKHPNHLWQVDSSVCVIYYLRDGSAAIEELEEGVHYKNKPHNLDAIASHLVIRYVLTDHATNLTRWRYFKHSESGEHTVEFLAWAMAPKTDPGKDPFEGKPVNLYVDLGIGSNWMVKQFCRRLGTELKCHAPKNSRATGSVENAQWRVESRFEQGLRFQRNAIRSFEDLNALAEVYQLHYNSTKKVGRHGMTRMDAWMHIREEHLMRTQPMEVLLSIATERPKTPKVSDGMRVEFNGRTYSVKDVPGAHPRGTVTVHWHPFKACAMALVEDEQGRETLIELPDVTGTVDPANDQWGWYEDSAEYGQEYKSRPDTEVDTNRKKLALIASGTNTQEADRKARRRKDFEPFNGEVDPFKAAKETELPTRITKRAAETVVVLPTVEALPLGHRAAARRLIEMLGDAWRPEYLNEISVRYPAGVPEADLEALAAEFRERGETPAKRPPLKAVK